MTENGYGKRTRVSEYPRKGRGGMGVKTVQLTEARGQLAGARVVRDGYQVMLISTGGTVIKMPVEDVKRLGRSTQGVIVMRLREGETVSSLAPVVDPNRRRRVRERSRTIALRGRPSDETVGVEGVGVGPRRQHRTAHRTTCAMRHAKAQLEHSDDDVQTTRARRRSAHRRTERCSSTQDE